MGKLEWIYCARLENLLDDDVHGEARRMDTV